MIINKKIIFFLLALLLVGLSSCLALLEVPKQEPDCDPTIIYQSTSNILPFWSPDGKKIIFLKKHIIHDEILDLEGNYTKEYLYSLNLESSEEVKIEKLSDFYNNKVNFISNDKIILINNKEHQPYLYIKDIFNNEEQIIDKYVESLVLSPDKQKYAYYNYVEKKIKIKSLVNNFKAEIDPAKLGKEYYSSSPPKVSLSDDYNLIIAYKKNIDDKNEEIIVDYINPQTEKLQKYSDKRSGGLPATYQNGFMGSIKKI